MTNWISRWFDKPKPVAKTVLRPTGAGVVAQPSVVPTAAKPADHPVPADTWQSGALILGEYRVERELGHGSMGTVYLVSRAQASEQRFAVKRVRVEGDIYRRHFLAELQTWLDLSEHPHLVACRFFRTVGDELVIFAEYVEGMPLSSWIEGGKITRLETALDLAIQFAWGLHAAHEQGVIHQDVKPGNALVTADGTVKVADFGLARAQSAAARAGAGNAGNVVVAHAGGMTEEYCSPEQAQDQLLSRQSDLWSWGVSVLEMFAGQVTWRSGVLAAEALEDFLAAQARGAASTKDRMPIPESVAAVLRRCFRDDPHERWPSLLSAAQELVQVYGSECGAAFPRGSPVMPTRDRGTAAALDRRIIGIEWDDPKRWLVDALKAAGRDPVEAEHLAQSPKDAHSRKAQAVGDLATYQEARAIFERLIAGGRSDLREHFAQMSSSQALVHRFLGDAPGAKQAYDRAIEICERLVQLENRRDLAEMLAMVCANKAVIVSDFGEHRLAKTLLARAATIYESLVNREGRHDLVHVLARVYMNMAVAVGVLGDYRGAAGHYDQAIVIHEHLVDEEGRRDLADDLAAAYMNKAAAVGQFGDNRGAASLLDRAIAIRERLVHREGRSELANELARAYVNKADTLGQLGDKQGAVRMYDQSIAIRERLVNLEGRRELVDALARVYVAKASAVGALGNSQGALSLYDEAISIYERAVNQEGRRELAHDLATAYTTKATTVSALGDHQHAVVLHSQAISIHERLVNQEGRRELANELATAYVLKAKVVNDSGDTKAAIGLYDLGIALFERLVHQEGRRELAIMLAFAQVVQAALLKQIGERDRASVLARSALTSLDNEVKRSARADLPGVVNWARQNLADLL